MRRTLVCLAITLTLAQIIETACFRQTDGSLVCEAIESGVYEVQAAPATSDARAFCSVDATGRTECCVTYCTKTADGHLVCTGLEQGRYRVVAAGEADVERMVHHIWATYSFEEDDDEHLVASTSSAGLTI